MGKDVWKKVNNEQSVVTFQASVTVAKSKDKKTKPKSVIEKKKKKKKKTEKASEIWRDSATFLSACGQIEFDENEINYFENLKTEWQCSQLAQNVVLVLKYSRKQQHSMPVLANKALSTNFKLESKPDSAENETFATEGLTTIPKHKLHVQTILKLPERLNPLKAKCNDKEIMNSKSEVLTIGLPW